MFDGFRIVERRTVTENGVHVEWKLVLFVDGEVAEEPEESLVSLDMTPSEDSAIAYGRISSATKAIERLLAFGTDIHLIAELAQSVRHTLRDRSLDIPGLSHFKTDTATTFHFVGRTTREDTRFIAAISPDAGLEVEDNPKVANLQFRQWVNDTLRQVGVLLESQDLYKLSVVEGGNVIDR